MQNLHEVMPILLGRETNAGARRNPRFRRQKARLTRSGPAQRAMKLGVADGPQKTAMAWVKG